MEPVKKTFKELKDIDYIVGNLYSREPSLKSGKFGYAYNRFYQKNILPLQREYDYEMSEIAVKNAMVDDKTKELIGDPMNRRGFKFTREGLLKAMREEKVLTDAFEGKLVEVKPHFIEEIPPTLTEEEKLSLLGIIIK